MACPKKIKLLLSSFVDHSQLISCLSKKILKNFCKIIRKKRTRWQSYFLFTRTIDQKMRNEIKSKGKISSYSCIFENGKEPNGARLSKCASV